MIGTLVVAITSAILFKFEKRGRKKNRRINLYLEIQGTELLNDEIDWLIQEFKAKNILVVPPRTAVRGNVGLEVSLPYVGNEDTKAVLQSLRKQEGVLFAMET